ncbi:hypothetical protein CKO31_16600 [Thiohalocapsa halophila]|uniref:Polysaccharide deacetylase family protein n=1 Tax=Thiohalocapsa halophila TaxID=69359 RepID=A0ABS1CKA2_9GAMM|nr:hypothetical protein [Thiohalocapsa halophila]MBK1632327.1 hypothetical protein [Thiohalocapsa halophila]
MAHPLHAYLALLDDLRAAGFRCHPIRDYFAADGAGQTTAQAAADPDTPCVYLRHDVDRLPARAVTMAEAEAARGIRSSYYFRCDARMRFPATAMRRIADLGHETGFHYESLSRTRGDRAAAIERFVEELAACRAILPVTTVSPHGAPLAASSNMDFTASIDPANLDLLGDATDMDYTDMLYVTDTGGTFGSPHNLRDRPRGRCLTQPVPPAQLAGWIAEQVITRITLSCHPERWPAGGAGLATAVVKDGLANIAKVLAARTRSCFLQNLSPT